MTALSGLDRKMKEAALDISIKHLLRYKEKSPEEIADHILQLCMGLYKAEFPIEKAKAFKTKLIALFKESDDNGIRSFIQSQLDSFR